MTKQIFEPLHMKSTGVAYDQTALNHLAIGYSNAAQDHPVKIGYSLKLVDGAGSIYSTVQDLYKLDRALYTNQLLSTNSRLLMQQQHVKEKYGYGWFLRERGGVWDVMYQSGDLPGFSTFISRRTVRDEVIILLSNSEGLDLDDLENDISRILKSVN